LAAVNKTQPNRVPGQKGPDPIGPLHQYDIARIPAQTGKIQILEVAPPNPIAINVPNGAAAGRETTHNQESRRGNSVTNAEGANESPDERGFAGAQITGYGYHYRAAGPPTAD